MMAAMIHNMPDDLPQDSGPRARPLPVIFKRLVKGVIRQAVHVSQQSRILLLPGRSEMFDIVELISRYLCLLQRPRLADQPPEPLHIQQVHQRLPQIALA